MGEVSLTIEQTYDRIFAGVISGAGTLVKSGPAVLTLSGDNVDGGNFIVNEGTLFIGGSTSSSNTIAVTNNAVLAGDGTINGSASLSAGAELSPGGSNVAGNITIASLNMGDGSSIRWDYATTSTFDVVTITNEFNIATGSVITLKLYNTNALPEPCAQQFVIATWPASSADPDPSVTWNIVKPAGGGADGWASPQVTVDNVNNRLILTFPQCGFPAVDNGQGASSITTNSAILNGNYTATGSTAEVHIYWGTSDGGTNKSNWENVYVHGTIGVGPISTAVSNLVYGFRYSYRCYASNAVGECWASLSSNFSVQARLRVVDGIRGSIFDNAGAPSSLILADSTFTISYSRVFTGANAATLLGKPETPRYNSIITGDLYSGTDLAGYTVMFPGYVTRDSFASSYSGLLIPRYSGQHDFRWNCDDWAIMYIDINHDGIFQSSEGSMLGTATWYGTNRQDLVAGEQYNFMFSAADGGGGESVNLWVTEPGQTEARVNPTLQAGMWKCYVSDTLSNLPATEITITSAVLNAVLMAPTEVYDVYAYWGTNNAGTDAGAWANNAFVGSWTNVESTNISFTLSSLTPDTMYYFTFRAVNDIAPVWADTIRDFKTKVVPASYARKMRIDFTGYDKEEVLTNFPVIVTLGEHLPGFFYYNCSPGGTDIRFMDGSETTELNYETELWNTNGYSCMWVQVPEMTSNCSIWVYWNNPASTVAPPYTTNGSTWANGHSGVWHMSRTNAYGYLIDSSAHGFDGVNSATAWSDGKISTGRLFNGSAYLNVGDIMPASSYTKMAWVYRTNSAAAANCIIGGGIGANDHIFWMNAGGGTTVSAGHNNSWYLAQDPVAVSVNTWTLVVVTYDADLQALTLYRDGIPVNQANSVPNQVNGSATYIGAYNAGNQFQGMLDEARVSSVPRSENWIWACYMNQGNDSAFTTYMPMFGIKNLAVSNLTAVSATPVATLYGTGLATSVTLYFGPTDGGTNTSSWSSYRNLGSFNTLSSTNIASILTSLKPDTIYYYRFYASNTADSAWTAQAYFKTMVTDWQMYYRMKISFPGYDRTESLQNFPALLIFNTGIGDFKYNSFRPGATDLRFLNGSKSVELNYQIEEWNSNGNSYIWVQVPDFTNNCSIWAYWGASSYVMPCTTNGATWSGYYGSVWHLRDGTSNTLDSVARYTGTPANVTMVTGMISRALNFNGTNSLMNTTYAQPAVTSYTVSAWIRTTDSETNKMVFNDRGGGSGMSLSLGFRSVGGTPFFGLDATDILIGQDADAPVNDDAWHYLAGTWNATYGSLIDPAQFKIYVDGFEVTTTPTSTGTAYSPLSGAGGAQIAYHQMWTTNLAAKLDEIRADTSARSSNWIWACYMNQGTNRSTFVQYDPVTRVPLQGTVIRLR